MEGFSTKLKVPVKRLHELSMKSDQGSMHCCFPINDI